MILTPADQARIAKPWPRRGPHRRRNRAGRHGRVDRYLDVALAWSAFMAFLALAALEMAPAFYVALVDRLLGLWATEWSARAYFGLALTVAVIKFAAMLALLQWRRLRLWLTPRRSSARVFMPARSPLSPERGKPHHRTHRRGALCLAGRTQGRDHRRSRHGRSRAP
jgi:type VI protein secretion system component VasK